jgi:hypothetical protein
MPDVAPVTAYTRSGDDPFTTRARSSFHAARETGLDVPSPRRNCAVIGVEAQ